MVRRCTFFVVMLSAVVLSASVSSAYAPTGQTPAAQNPAPQKSIEGATVRQEMSREMDESMARLDHVASVDWSFWPPLVAITLGAIAIEASRRWRRETAWRRPVRNYEPEPIIQPQPMEPIHLFEKRRR
jgi:hypothetical protein